MFDDDPPSPIWVSHLVVRGAYLPDTVRCTSDNPFRSPDYLKNEFGDFTANARAFKCYIDMRSNAYIIGSGPSTLTVMIFIWFYWDGEYAPYEGDDKTEQDLIEEARQRFEIAVDDFSRAGSISYSSDRRPTSRPKCGDAWHTGTCSVGKTAQ